jgi:hypothetical protein
VVTPLRPPHRPLERPADDHITVWQPEQWMFRVFHVHPGRPPLEARGYGPLAARFDPHLPDADGRPHVQPDGRGVIYLGETLGTGLAEAFPDQWPEVRICPNHRAVQASPAAAAPLLDLTGDGAMAIGAVGTLGSGDEARELTQAWARAIYEDLPDLRGVKYRGAHQGGVSIAVWERAGVLVPRPGTPADGVALVGPLAGRVKVALASQGRRPVHVTSADCDGCRKAGLA